MEERKRIVFPRKRIEKRICPPGKSLIFFLQKGLSKLPDLEGTEGIAGHLGDSVALEVELGQAREALERPEVGQSTDPVVAQIQERQPLVVAENSRLDFSDLIVVSRWSLTDSNNFC